MNRLWVWPLIAAIVGFGVWGVFAYRASVSLTAQDKLCLVIYRLEANALKTIGRKGTPGYTYYHDHPDELLTIKSNIHVTLQELPCKP